MNWRIRTRSQTVIFSFLVSVQSEAELELGVFVGVLVLDRLRRGSASGQTELEMIGHRCEQSLNAPVHLVGQQLRLLNEHLL